MTVFAVITKVPTTLRGNLACGEIYIYPQGEKCLVGSNIIVDPPTTIKGYDKMFAGAVVREHSDNHTVNLKKRQLLFCSVSVFKLGEILILESKWGRTIPDGRKPSKWDVDYECFRSLKKAIARAKEVGD
jgi:hypothetical protein